MHCSKPLFFAFETFQTEMADNDAIRATFVI
jgi:hypothetical protein